MVGYWELWCIAGAVIDVMDDVKRAILVVCEHYQDALLTSLDYE